MTVAVGHRLWGASNLLSSCQAVARGTPLHPSTCGRTPGSEQRRQSPGLPADPSPGMGGGAGGTWQAPRRRTAAPAAGGGPRPREAGPGRKPPSPRSRPAPGAAALGWAGRRDLGISGGGASWLPGTAAGSATSPPRQERAGGAAAPGRERGARGRGQGRGTQRPGPGTWQPPRPPESFPGVG